MTLPEHRRRGLHGVVVAEGLVDPAVVNDLSLVRAGVAEDMPLGDGSRGPWHLYWVEADEADVERVQLNTRHGWYAHFWDGERLLVVFDDGTFQLPARDPSAWRPAIEHGRSQGIPEEELDFPME